MQGRYGDTIAASIIANMLIEKGYTLYWYTVPAYVELVEAACPEALCFGSEKYAKNEFWGDATTEQIRQEFPDCIVINAQFGCTENHDTYLASGLHPVVWLKQKAEVELEMELPDNYADYLIWRHTKMPIVTKQPYCIIAPEAKTCDEMSEDFIKAAYLEAQKTWYPALLVKDAAKFTKNISLSGYSFVQCVEIIRGASHFVGLDSGLAWASLYSDCTKVIYHHKERFDKVNTAFNLIDPKAQDSVQ